MAVTILSESYGPRKPFITCEADSLDDLAGLVCAEGSTATVDGTEYVLDRVTGWVVPGSGGGGGTMVVTFTYDDDNGTYSADKTYAEVTAALAAGTPCFGVYGGAVFTLNDTLAGDETPYEFISFKVSIGEDAFDVNISVLFLCVDDSVAYGYATALDDVSWATAPVFPDD